MRKLLCILLVLKLVSFSESFGEFGGLDNSKDIFGDSVQSDDDDSDDVSTPFPKAPPVLDTKNINCDDFANYALNCTSAAAIAYNSSRKQPPPANMIHNWCAAIKLLTNCAREWNNECIEITSSHFNEESVNGHNYVMTRICDDELFLQDYKESAECVSKIASRWEYCYQEFADIVDQLKKNITREWTHYESHFYLCCAKAQFRRCTFDLLFKIHSNCTKDQAVTVQKFTVIVSEGDVFQDCDFNMVYNNCPGGDPRPKSLKALYSMRKGNPRPARKFFKKNRALHSMASILHSLFITLSSLAIIHPHFLV